MQQRPAQAGRLNIGFGQEIHVKGDDKNLDVESLKFCFMLPQLRQVRPAGRSAEMPVKYQQRPVSAQINKSMHVTLGIWQFKWNGLIACTNRHDMNSLDVLVVIYPAKPIGRFPGLLRPFGLLSALPKETTPSAIIRKSAILPFGPEFPRKPFF